MSVIILLIFLDAFNPYFKSLSDFKTASELYKRNDSLLLNPHTGKEILPASVQYSLHILDSLNSTDYFIYGSFSQTQQEFYQRMQESAWPVRNDTSSKLVFGYPEELNKIEGLKVLFNRDNFCVGIR